MKISIITATLNNRPFIESCITSAATQTHNNIEFIIIDGGSTDGTLDIIKQYGDRISKWVSGPDKGIYDALNKGISLATGEVVGFLHADDLYAADTVLETVAKCFEGHNVDSCYGDLLYVSKDDTNRTVRYWKSSPFEPALLKKGWMPPHPAFFVKRTLYEKYGVFDTSFKIAADYELMLRLLARHKISTCYIPEVLVRMRMGGTSNRSLKNLLRKSSEDYRAMKMHHVGGLATLLRKNLSKIPQFFSKQ